MVKISEATRNSATKRQIELYENFFDNLKRGWFDPEPVDYTHREYHNHIEAEIMVGILPNWYLTEKLDKRYERFNKWRPIWNTFSKILNGYK